MSYRPARRDESPARQAKSAGRDGGGSGTALHQKETPREGQAEPAEAQRCRGRRQARQDGGEAEGASAVVSAKIGGAHGALHEVGDEAGRWRARSAAPARLSPRARR